MLRRIKPMLARLGDLPADDAGWAYETKWDGARAMVYVEDRGVQAFTRNDKDLVGSFPELVEVGATLGARSAVLDGELVALGPDGRPSFGLLQQRLHLVGAKVAGRAVAVPVTYVVFDLVHLDGRWLLKLPYDERRAELESLSLTGGSVATAASMLDAHGADVLQAARDNGLEGILAKRRDAPYRPGERTAEWIKIKIFRTQEVVIGGWTEGRGERTGSMGALLLGLPADGGLRYVGKVGTGFSEAGRRELLDLLGPLQGAVSPFVGSLGRAEAAGAHFVRPALVGEVSYGEWTADGRLRHPAWRGLRIDKDPGDVVRES
jgi:bifunctional non-homologous end joining protein LigD